MKVRDFDFLLPEDLIAQTPLEPRDSSRLLVIDRNSDHVSHRIFRELAEYLRPGDLLIANDTKVIPARLIGQRADSGGKVEIFLLHRQSHDVWETLVKPGKKMKPGQVVVFGERLRAEILHTTEFGGRCVRFLFEGVFEQILDELGETPLPPYIHQRLENPERYQTVYARERGSSAAPTAGLHFTEPLIASLKQQGIDFAYVTLHIGLGTFRPVRCENVADHVMHHEFYEIPPQTVDAVAKAKQNGGRVIAVGTTAVRTLESSVRNGQLVPGSGWSDIFIYPGYSFQVIDAMITNFHLPQSTLLMLVSAFAGTDRVRSAYREAVEKKYRFFSFGDAMLIV